jgi:hypothetical protein
MELPELNEEQIQNKIYSIRGKQVMFDYDLATIYQVETRVLNQAVKRNIKRFPPDFMFQVTKEEYDILISQFVTSKTKQGGRRKLPYVFTEQGVSMLSSVLKSDTAIEVSIRIMHAFVNMRKFLYVNANVFQQIEHIEQKLKIHDENFDKIFKALQSKEIKPKHGIYFNGQVFDAWLFVSELIKSAKRSIILIDNYIDETVLTLFSKNQNVEVHIYTANISKQLQLDLKKYNAQYKPIKIDKFKLSHDRFLIIDKKDVYHIGASLKDLGKRWFGFSKFDIEAVKILNRL